MTAEAYVWEAECVDLASWGPDDSSVAPRRIDRELYSTESEARAALARWSINLTRNEPTHVNLDSKHWHCGNKGYSLTKLLVYCERPATKRGGAARRKEESSSQSDGVVSDGNEAEQCAVSDSAGVVDPTDAS